MREYKKSHSWITFSATDINDLGPDTWLLLGKARAECRHLAETPLKPEVAKELMRVALVRSTQATTAIEGNTLTVEQVTGILHGTYTAPASRAYQQQEVQNVLDALNDVVGQATAGTLPAITPALICEFNRRVLQDVHPDGRVVPGQVRDYSVVVGNYQGAPAEDCPYLLERLAEWLESDDFRHPDPELQFALHVAAAVYAHLYIAWIHPFGDGNGRTARLLEFFILARCGMVPLPAALLLSNHYNLTRDRYYRELAGSRQNQTTRGFLNYAVQGFSDGLVEQNQLVRGQQMELAWRDYVNEELEKLPPSPARERQRALVLNLPHNAAEAVSRTDVPQLTPELAGLYSRTGPRTLARDLNRMEQTGLLLQTPDGGWLANRQLIEAFKPSAPPPTEDSE